jgi:hypothetical protein
MALPTLLAWKCNNLQCMDLILLLIEIGRLTAPIFRADRKPKFALTGDVEAPRAFWNWANGPVASVQNFRNSDFQEHI